MSASNSRSISPAAQPELQRNPSHERSASVPPGPSGNLSQSDEDDSDSRTQPQHRRGARRKNNVPRYDDDANRQVVDHDDANQISRGQPPPQQQQVAQEEEKNDDPLKLRLDLNLNVDIQVRASVHGDVTLSMLR